LRNSLRQNLVTYNCVLCKKGTNKCVLRTISSLVEVQQLIGGSSYLALLALIFASTRTLGFTGPSPFRPCSVGRVFCVLESINSSVLGEKSSTTQSTSSPRNTSGHLITTLFGTHTDFTGESLQVSGARCTKSKREALRAF
jgi:hypothetical protein